ncbi:hypothetical protein J3R82DRAFT_11952 [Butyriboletus roseoflavus]|nr:hypothetical protein J3R82DRAFT_11952 [Butyriboletus roseoflavus]
MHYLCYIVTPHIVSQLIMQDLNISSFVSAYNTMVASSDVGDSIHMNEDDDDEADLINHKTTLSFKGHAMHEREGIEAAARTLVSLQNYKAPEPGNKVCLESLSRVLGLRLMAARSGSSTSIGNETIAIASHGDASTSKAPTKKTGHVKKNPVSGSQGVDLQAGRSTRSKSRAK